MIKSVDIYITQLGNETAGNWYTHMPKAMCEHEGLKLLWTQGIQTDTFYSVGRT